MLIAAGQPSTNPRLVKSIEALASEFQLTVLYSFWASWADENDNHLFQQYPQVTFIRAGGHPSEEKRQYLRSRIVHKCARTLAGLFPKNNLLSVHSIGRSYPFLLRKAKNTKADLYLSYNLAALPVAVIAAKKNGAASVADLEDFYRGQWAEGSEDYKQSKQVEERFIPRTTNCISASPVITATYQKLFPKIEINTVLNVFSKRYLQAGKDTVAEQSINSLKLFWFSQTVGKNRGLEEAIEAMGSLAGKNIRLTILGNCSAEMFDFLLALATQHGVKKEQLSFVKPLLLDSIFPLASKHDVGLAMESGNSENSKICLSNKLFTYLLSGLAVVASNTPAQADFLDENPSIGFVHRTGDNAGLVALLKRFMEEPDLLQRCKQNALRLATETYNWENESKKYLSIIKRCLN